jgi:hypothetical protein
MTRLTKNITIDAAVDVVFDFLIDPANLRGFPMAGNVEYAECCPNHRLVLSSPRGFMFSFTMEPEATRTKLILAEEDVPSNWFEAAIDAVAMKLTEQDLDTCLAYVQAAVEARVATEPRFRG